MDLNAKELMRIYYFFKDFERGINKGYIKIGDKEYRKEFMKDVEWFKDRYESISVEEDFRVKKISLPDNDPIIKRLNKLKRMVRNSFD